MTSVGDGQTVIAIVGGGLSGALAALHLARDHPALDARIVVIEPRDALGAGVAYDTRAPELRINVTAARMVMFAEDPLHFDRWLRAGDEATVDPAAVMPDGALYPRRGRVGDYVASMLAGTRIEHVRARAVGCVPGQSGFLLALDDQQVLKADVMVLAVSNPPPSLPGFLRDLPEALTDRLVVDPWDAAAVARIATDDRVLVVGTGLTACDVVASLRGQGHRGSITLLSRHGLLPRPRTPHRVEPIGDFSTAPARTALALLRHVRCLLRETASRGRPWEDVIAALRDQATTLWQALPVVEQRRVQRHLRVVWDAHRFQSAPQIDAHLRAAEADGQLTVVAGRVAAVSASGTQERGVFRIRAWRRGTGAIIDIPADTVVNCTGPGHGLVVETNPILSDLAVRHALVTDPCRLGVATDMSGRLVRADGTAWRNAFVVGPLARGTFGELMGLPQISTQPRRVARQIAMLLDPDGTRVADQDVVSRDVIS